MFDSSSNVDSSDCLDSEPGQDYFQVRQSTSSTKLGSLNASTPDGGLSAARTHQQKLRVRRQRWKSAVELHHMLDELRLSLTDPEQLSPPASLCSSPANSSMYLHSLSVAKHTSTFNNHSNLNSNYNNMTNLPINVGQSGLNESKSIQSNIHRLKSNSTCTTCDLNASLSKKELLSSPCLSTNNSNSLSINSSFSIDLKLLSDSDSVISSGGLSSSSGPISPTSISSADFEEDDEEESEEDEQDDEVESAAEQDFNLPASSSSSNLLNTAAIVFDKPVVIKALADQSAPISHYLQHHSVPSVSVCSSPATHTLEETSKLPVTTATNLFCQTSNAFHSNSSYSSLPSLVNNSFVSNSTSNSAQHFTSNVSDLLIVSNQNTNHFDFSNHSFSSSYSTSNVYSSSCPSNFFSTSSTSSSSKSNVKMQTLAETQYNHLAYHIAALSCARPAGPSSSSTSGVSSSFSSCASQITSPACETISSTKTSGSLLPSSANSSSASSSATLNVAKKATVTGPTDEDSAYSSGSSSSCSPFNSPYSSPPGSPSSSSVFEDSSSDGTASPQTSDSEPSASSKLSASSAVSLFTIPSTGTKPITNNLVKTRKIGVVQPPIDFNNNRQNSFLLSIAPSPVVLQSKQPTTLSSLSSSSSSDATATLASLPFNSSLHISSSSDNNKSNHIDSTEIIIDTLCSKSSSSSAFAPSLPSSEQSTSPCFSSPPSSPSPTSTSPTPTVSAEQQPRVRKTSILRNQTSTDSTSSSSNSNGQTGSNSTCCKKEVKFADALGFELEKIKYFPPGSPQTRVKRHSVNVMSSRESLSSSSDSSNGSCSTSSVWSQQRSQPARKRSEPHWFGGHVSDYWSQYAYEHLRPHTLLNGNPSNLSSNNHRISAPNLRATEASCATGTAGLTCNLFTNDKYCGDMFDAQLPGLPLINLLTTNSSDREHALSRLPTNSSSSANANHRSNYSTVSLLPLNFGQPFIQSEFPARLRTQSVLLHSVQCSSGLLVGLISVWNHTFEKRVSVRYSTDKWTTERHAEGRYMQPDRLASADQFHFELRLRPEDFADFDPSIDSDRTLVFAVRYETSDHRVFWDNNYGQDYRIRCRF